MNKNLANKETIKGLNSQLAILIGKRSALTTQCNSIQKELSENKSKIQSIKDKILLLETEESKDITITEHAILRYCQRVLGVDVDDIKSKIITDKLREMIRTLGDTGTYPYESFRLKVVDKVIVTILD